MTPTYDREPPATNRRPSHVIDGDSTDATPLNPLLDDLDARGRQLRGKLVVQVQIDDEHYRTVVYQSVKAAENAVRRAQSRGKRAHVTLCQLLPIGVVVGLGGPR